MESTAAWAGPYELQLANWTADDAQVWAPAVDHPLEYASIVDIFGSSCSLQQPYIAPTSSSSSSRGQQQLVEYNYYNYYAAAAQRHDPDPVEAYMKRPELLFLERKVEFKEDAKLVKKKMHRYPPSIQALGDWYTVPKVVAIGPYFHRRDHLKRAEKMKHVAARYCIEGYKTVNNNSGLSVQDMYAAVDSVAAAIYVDGLYDEDVMEGIDYENEFLPMMFYDACFLVIYMLRKSGKEFDEYLHDFFESNDNDIAHDIMLLENQIPLQVVDAVMEKCTSDHLQEKKDLIDRWRSDGFLHDRADLEVPGVDQDQDYYYDEAPHLLGLIRFYAVGRERRKRRRYTESDLENMKSISISASAIELTDMGISIAANKTTELTDMGLPKKWIVFAELSMAPLSLNEARASWLVNMAALELCTTQDFLDDKAKYKDSAVCSYLLLLCMLMHREEDVHELRTKGILQGAGLTNKQALDFFASLQSLRLGLSYVLVMADIQKYKNRKPWMIMLYKFGTHNWKFITGFVGAVVGFIGLYKTLSDIKAGNH